MSHLIESQPEDVCREIYAETREIYEEKSPAMKDAALGFRILYGPPLINPPVLFLGYQPGGHNLEGGEQHETWPAACEYAVQSWPLAVRMKETFGHATVAQSTGLNAIFFRARRAADWRRIERPVRNELTAFSLARAQRIVRALAPDRVVIIGLGTFDMLTSGTSDKLGTDRVLVKRGDLWGVPAIGTIHLSGARVRREDRNRISAHFADMIAN